MDRSIEGGASLADLRVLVVGAGGLGSPALLALGAAGARRVTIIDPDRVELSNLHRQILYSERDLGRAKAEVAAEKLQARFADLEVKAEVRSFLGGAGERVLGCDVVLDGTDRVETKLRISDACVDAGVPYVFAGVVGFEGQALGVLPGRSSCVRCLFDEAPPPGAAPTCAELGILGPVAGVVAARQVEVARSLFSAAPCVDRLWTYDGRLDRERWVGLARAADCRGCGSRKSERGRFFEAGPVRADMEAPEIDLSAEVCPRTFTLARRALDRLAAGERLWVRIRGDEAARGVPVSAAAAGHRVLASIEDGGTQRVLIERGEAAGAGEESSGGSSV
ncbi:MAG: ThiF family adenylyltransferase [Deltaproteobacteria bacterium]|nr:ThiF family adenylyltransferase [Deltaproteobacteria bacterium]